MREGEEPIDEEPIGEEPIDEEPIDGEPARREAGGHASPHEVYKSL